MNLAFYKRPIKKIPLQKGRRLAPAEMKRVSLKAKIQAPADQVWKIIRNFSAVDQYVAGIFENKTEGEGIGAIRTLTLAKGAQVAERLEKLDDKNRTLRYSVLETPLPMKNYVAWMRVKDLGDDQCQLTWESTFEAEKGEEARVKKIIGRLYQLGFKGLKKLSERTAAISRKLT